MKSVVPLLESIGVQLYVAKFDNVDKGFDFIYVSILARKGDIW